MRHVMFFRDLRRFNGGHLKVWDYFTHVRHSALHVPHIRFSPNSDWSPVNPWYDPALPRPEAWPDVQPDIYFFSAADWLVLDPAQRDASPVPVINLLQHQSHAWPADPRYAFLAHKAVRICVSEEVAEEVRATRRANGPVLVVKLGTDLSLLRAAAAPVKDIPLLIAAFKNRELGTQLQGRLEAAGRRAELLTDQIPRREFLARLARAETAVVLPNAVEGFYLPALEAMALRTLVVCPDAVGNRSFCLDQVNCLRPAYELAAIEKAVASALNLAPERRQAMLDQAAAIADNYDLAEERKVFLRLLDELPSLW
jgi:glycosyltransferase involved in cell wall biosynthesis